MIFINFKFIRRPTVSLETNTSEELQGGEKLSLSGLTGIILHVVLLMRLKVHLFDGGAFQHYQLYLSEGWGIHYWAQWVQKRAQYELNKNEILPMVLDLTLNRVKIKCVKTRQILHVKYSYNQAVQLICKPEVCKCYMVEWRSQHSPLKI